MSTGAGGQAMPDLSGMVSALLSNPAAMSIFSSLLSGMGNAQHAQPSEASSAPAPLSAPSALLPPTGAVGQGGAARDDRAALLLALRPFLPPDKCEMIDGLLRILDLLVLIRKRR